MRRISIITLSRLGLALALPLLSACAANWRVSDAYPGSYTRPACQHWSLDVVAPGYMEAWVEDLEVKDDRGYWVRIPKGVVGELDQTVGWAPPNRIGGFGARIGSAGAPMEIYVRWQSLAEPQTYRWQFTVPESMRRAITAREPVVYLGKLEKKCRSDITIGVAPGGRTIVWISGLALTGMELMRGQAEVEPLGPDQGRHEGRYVRFSDEAKQYVEKNGIPYGSWDP